MNHNVVFPLKVENFPVFNEQVENSISLLIFQKKKCLKDTRQPVVVLIDLTCTQIKYEKAQEQVCSHIATVSITLDTFVCAEFRSELKVLWTHLILIINEEKFFKKCKLQKIHNT